MSNKEKAPENTAVRLSLCLRYLREMKDDENISSEQLAQLTGIPSARIRKDLSYFGQFGTPGKGYTVGKLKEQISKALGLDRQWNIALVGVGKLGRALLNYLTFKKSSFHIRAGFDVEREKIGICEKAPWGWVRRIEKLLPNIKFEDSIYKEKEPNE